MRNPKIKKTHDFLSIILPTYNESENILLLIQAIKKVLKKNNFEILVVDDDSPDRTGYLVQKKYALKKNIRALIRKKDHGLAASILAGIKKSNGSHIIVMDTDFNHDPKILSLFISQKNSYDLLIGSRYINGGGMENRMRYYLSFIYNVIIKLLLGLKTHDNLSGFFLIEKSHLSKMNLERIFKGYGDYFIRFLKVSDTNGLRIKEIPVYYKNRVAGESKSKFVSMFLSYSQTVMEILNKDF